MPFDLVPVVLLPFAWMDDLLLWIYIVWSLKEYLDKYTLGEQPVDISDSLKGKDIIDEGGTDDEGSD
jgi:uncharacterized membrane protein YkvA (DUF1232 family)